MTRQAALRLFLCLLAACGRSGAEDPPGGSASSAIGSTDANSIVAEGMGSLAGGAAVGTSVAANVALRVGYCQSPPSGRAALSRPVLIEPDSPGAYACGLYLTFSKLPLCSGFAPTFDFQVVTVSLGTTPGVYPVQPAGAQSAEVVATSYGDPSPCREEPSGGGALCAYGDQASATAGAFTLDGFVDGGASAPSRAWGSFTGLELPALRAKTGEPPVAAVPEIGPLQGTFVATSCSVGFEPPDDRAVAE